MKHLFENWRKYINEDRDDGEADFLYHTTYIKNIDNIADNGLEATGESQFGGGYAGHSQGRIFFTEQSGLSYWLSKREMLASNSSDFKEEEDLKWLPVVLRVEREVLEDIVDKEEGLPVDMLGSRDSGHGSWYVEDGVPPEDIEIWTGDGWLSIRDAYEEVFMDKAIENSTYTQDEDEDVGWWEPDFNLFSPFQK